MGLSICELYIVDAATRNLTLVNLFTELKFPVFPSPPKTWSVYSQLTNGFGEIVLDLAVIQLSTDRPIAAFRRTIRFTDRLQEVRYLFKFEDCVFPEAGSYEVALSANSEPLARTRIRLVQI